MNITEELVSTETNLRRLQSKCGYSIIIGTAVVCLGIVLLVLFSGSVFNDQAPAGATAQIILSQQFVKLIVVLSIPILISLIGGIILIKASVKTITGSYWGAFVSIEKFLSEQEDESPNKIASQESE